MFKTKHLWSSMFISVVAIMYVLISVFVAIPSDVYAFAGGDGSSRDPYEISTCAELYDINNDLDATYELTANIDCSFTPTEMIGNETTPFSGTFNGRGYTIANITFADDSISNMGLFGYASEATITNVNLDNIVFEGLDAVGALVGFTYQTTISYIGVTNSNIASDGQYAGSIVGYLGGSTIGVSYAEDAVVTGSNLVGGLAGITIGPSTIYDSYFQGSLDGATLVGGITGQVGAGPAIVGDTYADAIFVDAGSAVVGATGSGGSVIRSFMASAPYLENNTESPLDSWDFDDIWEIREGDYPGLQPYPEIECEQVIVTDTTIDTACATTPALPGTSYWEIEYAFEGSTDWQALDNQSGDGFSALITDLLPGTDYTIRFRFVDSIAGTSFWGRIQAGTTGDSDIDGDGVSNQTESLGPNDGDTNDDGIADYTQANITSFESFISEEYVSIETSCDNNFNTQIGLESEETKDVAFDYETGLVGFVGRDCGVGAEVDVKLYFYGNYSEDVVLRKYVNGSYTQIPDATLEETTIDGSQVTVASYTIKDGGDLDDDGAVDGNIVDPVGLAKSVLEAPNTGLRKDY